MDGLADMASPLCIHFMHYATMHTIYIIIMGYN